MELASATTHVWHAACSASHAAAHAAHARTIGVSAHSLIHATVELLSSILLVLVDPLADYKLLMQIISAYEQARAGQGPSKHKRPMQMQLTVGLDELKLLLVLCETRPVLDLELCVPNPVRTVRDVERLWMCRQDHNASAPFFCTTMLRLLPVRLFFTLSALTLSKSSRSMAYSFGCSVWPALG